MPVSTFAIDQYGERCQAAALNVLLLNRENRSRIQEPVSWIKLQQGGQAEIWVSHITVNHGTLGGRDERTALDLELDLEADFPGHIEEVDENETLQDFAKKFELDEHELWESVESVLIHELLIAGAKIRDALTAEGISTDKQCVICCGDEDVGLEF